MTHNNNNYPTASTLAGYSVHNKTAQVHAHILSEASMSLAAPKLLLTPQEYLNGERDSEIKHEYIDGEVYAMAGASEAHNTICIALSSQLYTHLRGKGCRVFMADMKTAIKTLKNTRFYYPDIQVTCADEDNDPYLKRFPVLIIEVLSPSTERQDRAEKFHAYRTLDSLQEYVLVAQDVERVEVYRRRTGWDLELYGTEWENEFHLESVDQRIAVADVYAQVALFKG
jgi:Uma2 family endonuclease